MVLALQSLWLRVADEEVGAGGVAGGATPVLETPAGAHEVQAPAINPSATAGAETDGEQASGASATVLEADTIAALQQQMLALINDARGVAGVAPVSWDHFAAEIGARHAQEMATHGTFSHWNFEGWGPDHRYSLAGGTHAVMENLHAFSLTYRDGRGAPVEDWAMVIAQAHQGLMESEGHRANILDPAHTHVGIGMAYNPQTGQFRLAQEFTNQYVQLRSALPREGRAGQQMALQGSIAAPGVENILLSLAYEPYPEPMWPVDLNQRGAYLSAAESVQVVRLEGAFDTVVALPQDAASGVYHVRIFADINGAQALIMDHVLVVQP